MTLHDLVHPSQQVHHWFHDHFSAPIDAVYQHIDDDLAA